MREVDSGQRCEINPARTGTKLGVAVKMCLRLCTRTCVCFYPKSLVLDVVRCVAYIDTQYCNAHTVLSKAEMLLPQITAASALH